MNTVEEITYFCKFDGSMQKAMCFRAEGREPRPLLVALHTWSGDHTQASKNYSDLCREKNWHFIFPDFRGPNWLEEGCGSELVVSDLEDAVAFMKKNANIDPNRVYLAGGSGGGHCTLLMAGRRPDLWSAASAWCPISDVAAWHKECLGTRHGEYSRHIESSCGGDPAVCEKAAREARKRSPLAWLPNAAGVKLDISTGIHDGHTGSVPVSQAINAFNTLAAEADRISEADIEYMVKNEKVPEHIATPMDDPAFGGRRIYLRRVSGNVRLTLFEGGHDLLPFAAVDWLSRQVDGKAADWTPGEAPESAEGNTELSR